jgi:hypothetical protein
LLLGWTTSIYAFKGENQNKSRLNEIAKVLGKWLAFTV